MSNPIEMDSIGNAQRVADSIPKRGHVDLEYP
jgi:hypothetical protein